METINQIMGKKTELPKIDELLKESWRIYIKNLKRFVGLLLLPILSFLPLGAIILLFQFNNTMFQGNSLAMQSSMLVLGFLGFVALVFIVYISVSAQAGILYLAANSETTDNTWTIFHRGSKFAVSYVWIGILTFILVALWSILFIIPGIIFGIYYSFAYWTLITENKTGMSALSRSKELVKNYWWAVVWKLIAITALYFLAFIIISIPLEFVQENSIAFAVHSVLIQVASFLVGPFMVIYQFLVFKRLKEIKS